VAKNKNAIYIEAMLKYKEYKKGTPNKLAILLHGYGSNSTNIIEIADYLADDTLYVAPNAPYLSHFGGQMWFEIYDNAGVRVSPKQVLEGTNTITPQLLEFVAHIQKERGFSCEDTYIMGFSQGAMLSLHYGLTIEQKLGGVIAFSGRLMFDIDSKTKQKFLVVHGDSDPVVGYDFFAPAVEKLASFGHTVSSLTCRGLEHSINEEGLLAAKYFMS
jgi:phospholipase/carboxylesterase